MKHTILIQNFAMCLKELTILYIHTIIKSRKWQDLLFIAFYMHMLYYCFAGIRIFTDRRIDMLHETVLLYRLTILYILHRVNYPISNNSLSNFLLRDDFTDYFNLQQLIGELIDDGYVAKEEYHGKTLYSITESGEAVLSLLSRELSSAIKADVDKYLTDHKMELRDDISVRSNYYQNDINHCTASMFIEEAGEKLLELNILTSSQAEAEKLCSKWMSSGPRLYPMIMNELMK